MKKINGIVFNGRFYEAVKETCSCNGCEFNYKKSLCRFEAMLCYAFDAPNIIFRYSQELTDKINNK